MITETRVCLRRVVSFLSFVFVLPCLIFITGTWMHHDCLWPRAEWRLKVKHSPTSIIRIEVVIWRRFTYFFSFCIINVCMYMFFYVWHKFNRCGIVHISFPCSWPQTTPATKTCLVTMRWQESHPCSQVSWNNRCISGTARFVAAFIFLHKKHACVRAIRLLYWNEPDMLSQHWQVCSECGSLSFSQIKIPGNWCTRLAPP